MEVDLDDEPRQPQQWQQSQAGVGGGEHEEEEEEDGREMYAKRKHNAKMKTESALPVDAQGKALEHREPHLLPHRAVRKPRGAARFVA